jgi:hypothetical protein
MIIKIGTNNFVNLKNIEQIHIIKKRFPISRSEFDEATNTVVVDRGYSMEFIGISGEKYSGTVFKTSAQLMAWWKKATIRGIKNDCN